VIECYENGHTNRRSTNERERMDYVNKTLDSHWIIFNPDEENFDIFSVISEIFVTMKTKRLRI